MRDEDEVGFATDEEIASLLRKSADALTRLHDAYGMLLADVRREVLHVADILQPGGPR